MMIQLGENKTEWDAFLLTQTNPSFLQSWDWGEFQASVGHEPIRARAYENGRIVSQVQGFVHKLAPCIKYLYAPRTRIMDHGSWISLLDYATQQGYMFVRVEAKANLSPITYNLSPTPNRQPQHTLILDLTQTEAELLSAMHPKTRYNIHLAERKGVAVREEKNSDVFWRLNQDTVNRDQFRSHPRGYYAQMLELGIVHQLTAEYQDQPVASNILIHFGGTLTYLHGASSLNHKEVMAPYLLQWRGIELAKKLGCKYYDLWGVAPLINGQGARNREQEICFHHYCWESSHKWSGITRFKAGFSAKGGPASGGGGGLVSYGQAVDVVLRPMLYKIYHWARKIV